MTETRIINGRKMTLEEIERSTRWIEGLIAEASTETQKGRADRVHHTRVLIRYAQPGAERRAAKARHRAELREFERVHHLENPRPRGSVAVPAAVSVVVSLAVCMPAGFLLGMWFLP